MVSWIISATNFWIRSDFNEIFNGVIGRSWGGYGFRHINEFIKTEKFNSASVSKHLPNGTRYNNKVFVEDSCGTYCFHQIKSLLS